MKIGEAAFERAAELAERERDAGVRRVQAALSGTGGRLVCECGDEISPARRAALPHTDKCIECARRMELRGRAA
jgi:RNA polymerase-binding transcription factor DksA